VSECDIFRGETELLSEPLSSFTTIYVAGMEIEFEGATETKRTIYYGVAGAFRVIEGENDDLYFRHSDHLGSTSVLSDASGDKVANSDVVYAPFGEIRGDNQLSELTDFGYTGQRLDRSNSLMYYGARYYLPSLRRFISADPAFPPTISSQALNRYAYVFNRPLNFIDPTGYVPLIDGIMTADSSQKDKLKPNMFIAELTSPARIERKVNEYVKDLADYGVTLSFNDGDRVEDQLLAAYSVDKAVKKMARAAQLVIVEENLAADSITDAEAFRSVFGSVTITPYWQDKNRKDGKICLPGYEDCHIGYNHQQNSDQIDYLYGGGKVSGSWVSAVQLAAHEIAHNLTVIDDFDVYHSPISAEDGTIIDYPEGFGVRAGYYSGSEGCSSACEHTADAIASWGLNDFVGPHAQDRAADIDRFIRGQIREIYDN